MAIKGFIPMLSILAESAAERQRVDPTERSTFPPVSIQRSIPQAIISTYAFCNSRFEIFCARRSLPPVRYVKNTNTTKSASTIVYFFTNLFAFTFYLLSTGVQSDFKIVLIIFSCVASSALNSPVIFPSFIT